MPFQEKQLGQLRPANTTAASVYSPGASTTTVIKTILITVVVEQVTRPLNHLLSQAMLITHFLLTMEQPHKY